MCGIAAFSKPAGSKTNARHLAHHLLKQIETRGSHAAGFAYSMEDGSTGFYKNNVPGSQLSLHELPRDAQTVILHTRYATQGDPADNRNNHPVISPDGRVALVHNGVISNDYQLRGELGITNQHGEVDSLVIPALIAQSGIPSLNKLRGYAAIAWINSSDAGTLSIARLKNSPAAYTHLFDGTFVMASTQQLLTQAIKGSGMNYGGVFDVADGRMMTVQGGYVLTHDPAPSMAYDFQSWNRHSDATSGGHGSTGARRSGPVADSSGTPLPRIVKAAGSEDVSTTPIALDKFESDLEAWRARRANDDAKIAEESLKRLPSSTWTDEQWEDYINQLDARDAADSAAESEADKGDGMSCEVMVSSAKAEAEEAEEAEAAAKADADGEGFYVLDSSNDFMFYPTLEDLETALKWLAEMSKSDMDLFDVETRINWVNHIVDIGHVENQTTLVSWVDDSAEIDQFESPAVRHLDYIRDGAARLTSLKGA